MVRAHESRAISQTTGSAKLSKADSPVLSYFNVSVEARERIDHHRKFEMSL